jgi:hypothetical protein
MAVTPKAKHPATPAAPRRVDRTSAVVTTTLIVLTALGVVTIFWEPLTALALGTSATDAVTEPRAATAGDGGVTVSPSTSASPSPSTSNGSSASLDASGSS